MPGRDPNLQAKIEKYCLDFCLNFSLRLRQNVSIYRRICCVEINPTKENCLFLWYQTIYFQKIFYLKKTSPCIDRGVTISKLHCEQGDYRVTAQLDLERFRHVRWRTTQRLKSGSLLALSSDHFHQHVLFFTVVDRNPLKIERTGTFTLAVSQGFPLFLVYNIYLLLLSFAYDLLG